MKQTKEQIEAYKAMAQDAPNSMEECIKKHLDEHCIKFKDNADKFDRCIKHLYETVMEMLGGEDAAVDGHLAGQVPAATCFKICRDYFDDELWKKEDELKAKEKEESERMAAKYRAPIKVPEVPKKPTETQLDFFAAMGV